MRFPRTITFNDFLFASGLLLFLLRSMNINEVAVAADFILKAAAAHIIVNTKHIVTGNSPRLPHAHQRSRIGNVRASKRGRHKLGKRVPVCCSQLAALHQGL
ncbi:hypothetical protein D3C75_999680 [compost metagenome]